MSTLPEPRRRNTPKKKRRPAQGAASDIHVAIQNSNVGKVAIRAQNRNLLTVPGARFLSAHGHC